MKKRSYFKLCILLIASLLLVSGCGKKGTDITKNMGEVSEVNPEETTTETVNEVEELEEVVEEKKTIVIPSNDEVLRFWADNYEDIISGKYTEDETRCLYVSAVDFDGDTMPELTVAFDDGRGNSQKVRYLDVDSDLKEIQYCKQVDITGKECDVEVPLEPMMMFENENKNERHYICLTYGTGRLTSTNSYYDICFSLKC